MSQDWPELSREAATKVVKHNISKRPREVLIMPPGVTSLDGSAHQQQGCAIFSNA